MSPGFMRRYGSKQSGHSARHAYECLRNLLNRNSLLLEQMAEIEADLGFYRPSNPYVQRKISRMADETLLLVEDLNVLSRDRFTGLYRTSRRIRSELTGELTERMRDRTPVSLSLSLEDAAHAPKGLVGNKAGNLGRVMQVLPDRVPHGFVVTTEAYWRYLYESGLFPGVLPLLREMEAVRDPDLLHRKLDTIRSKIRDARIPEEIQAHILRHSRREHLAGTWAVRSSAEGEDGRFSFAGQFESFLNIFDEDLVTAYRRVIESRYRPRAFQYRRALGMREIDTPMAVLFLRLVDARSAGVLYTRDPSGRGKDCMMVQSVWGLAQDLVGGTMDADRFILSRYQGDRILEKEIRAKPSRLMGNPAGGVRTEALAAGDAMLPSLDVSDLKRLWEVGQVLEGHFGMPMDIEWVIDPAGKIWVVQARRLVAADPDGDEPSCVMVTEKPLLEGGVSIHAGRASGPMVRIQDARLPPVVREGAILVLPIATPEIATLLPYIAGCITESGNPAGHAASLLREWKVPSLFGLEGAVDRLADEEVIGLDATHRKVYRGVPWPEPMEKKVKRNPVPATLWDGDPICRHIFPLRLTDPASPRFRTDGCASLHDIIRFVHEKAVESLFLLGDRQADKRTRKARRLKTDIPLNLMVLDLGRAFPEGEDRRRDVTAEQIVSVPFQSIWQGISDPEVSWAGRRNVSLKGFSSVLVSSLSASGAGSRRLGDWNYLLAAPDYMNLNLRLAYHYAMVDALVGESPENNFVNFRFRGGGAGSDRREMRARFLSETLLRSRFAVDRRGDLITAWFRRYPRARCAQALELLGRLLACSRQLDMLIGNAGVAHEYAERFLAGEYEAFR